MNSLIRTAVVLAGASALLLGFSPLDVVKAQQGSAEKPAVQQPPEKDEPKVIVIKGDITKSDPFDVQRSKCHHKVHVVRMVPGYSYVIDMKAKVDKKPQFDTFLRLEDAAGNELEQNDDFITTDSRIVFVPKKVDEYRVIATTFDQGFTGAYTLTITPVKAGTVPALAGTVFKVDAELTNADPLDVKRAGSHHKVHTVKLAPGKTYTIDMQSTAFDTWLRLEDSKGNELAFDDDSGGGLNSRIVFTPTKADTYRLVATTFGNGATGKYSITVTAK